MLYMIYVVVYGVHPLSVRSKLLSYACYCDCIFMKSKKNVHGPEASPFFIFRQHETRKKLEQKHFYIINKYK